MAVLHQSDIASWIRCPQAFMYQKAGQPRRQLSATAYGSVVHHAMETFERLRHTDGISYVDAVQAAIQTFEHYWHPMNIDAICDPVDLWLPKQTYSELRARGVDSIRAYCQLVKLDDHELLATEYGFQVPIQGTWDEDLNEPHVLAGTIDRLAVRHYKAYPVVCIDDYKCTAPDTPVLMADGTEQRADSILAGQKVLAWVDGELRPSSVLRSQDNGIRTCLRVTSRHSTQVVTPRHPFLVGNKWIEAMHLKAGDLLTLGLNATHAVVQFDKPRAGSNEAYALGVLVGDGYFGDTPKITQGDTDVVDALRSVLRDTGIELAGQGPGYHFRGRAALQNLLNEHGLNGKRASDKFIPEAVMAGGAPAAIGFLSGWLDTDGHVRVLPGLPPNINWSTTSETLARQGARLLANLDIKANVQLIRGTYDGETYWSWRVSVSTAYGVARCAELLQPRGRKAHQLALVPTDVDRAGPRNRWPAYDQDPVISVEVVPDQPTWALTVEDGTHVTAGVVTHNTGKEYRNLRQHLQFTAYAYATTQPEFWTGWRGEDGFGDERGLQLHQRFEKAARRGTWINMRNVKVQDAGWRGPDDYQRFALAVEQLVASWKAEIFPLSLSGDTCQFCEYRDICGGVGVPDASHGAPGLPA
jgi:hypothetical protein